MNVDLYDYQIAAVNKAHNGCILCGGVGSGKSRTSLAYFYLKECRGSLVINGKGQYEKPLFPKDLYIITTAKKRDSLEWEDECLPFGMSTQPELSVSGIKVTIDSWNNIKKYTNVMNSFFIFDEDKVTGKGAWVKAFLRIAKLNRWLIASATPGDTWQDYIPVFVANGFYKNRTEFTTRHCVFNRWSKYPQIDHYIDCGRLVKLRQMIMVEIKYSKKTISHDEILIAPYDKTLFRMIMSQRWNPYEGTPIMNASELCFLLRKAVNSDPGRIEIVKGLCKEHPKVIIFYNHDYELELLRLMGSELDIPTAEWNGHKHMPIPKTSEWIYLVNYNSGAEGWNCTETNCMIFYSQNYSYKTMIQAAGRIDRVNTPFSDLYYYHIRSNSGIDLAIAKALKKKQTFNESMFIKD